MQSKHRKEKVSGLLRERLALIVSSQAKNPLFRSITITHVNITADLRCAKVYYTLNEPSNIFQINSALEKAKGYLRMQIAKDLNLRFTPDLEFYNDNSLEMGAYIENLLAEL